MKPFKINRNSWHYKLNQNFFNNYDYCMEYRWEPKHNNFCAYWRATMFRMLFAAILCGMVIGAMTGIAYVFYIDPIGAAIFLGSLVGVFSFIIGCVAIGIYLENRKEAKSDKPDSLFVQKYKMHKSKICPMVEYD